MIEEKQNGLLLTPRQAATELAISERHLWGLTELPKIRIGRSVRYARADIEAFVASRKAVPSE